MLNATWKKYTLVFKQPSGTSRGILKEKESWFILLKDSTQPGRTFLGECGWLKGLSVDDLASYEPRLDSLCQQVNQGEEVDAGTLLLYPSIRMGWEMANLARQQGQPFTCFPSTFTEAEARIPINGLVWMGEKAFMKQQIVDKIRAGFTCVKLKIGAIDFQDELALLHYIRKEFSPEDIEIRVDANGAFHTDEALEKLRRLSDYQLHSIEQPIRQGQWEEMARLCGDTPLPIALDEELIGIHDIHQKKALLECIRPQYIILKPSLVGGFASSEEWIRLAEGMGLGWWATSALESNIGLNAIAQWAYTQGNPMPQGLGTGQLYTNNFGSPLCIEEGHLYSSKDGRWEVDALAG